MSIKSMAVAAAMLTGATPTDAPPHHLEFYTGPTAPIASFAPTAMMISCGTGAVSISMQTGAVTYTGDCSPDDGARVFWKTVEVMGAGRCATEPK